MASKREPDHRRGQRPHDDVARPEPERAHAEQTAEDHCAERARRDRIEGRRRMARRVGIGVGHQRPADEIEHDAQPARDAENHERAPHDVGFEPQPIREARRDTRDEPPLGGAGELGDGEVSAGDGHDTMIAPPRVRGIGGRLGVIPDMPGPAARSRCPYERRAPSTPSRPRRPRTRPPLRRDRSRRVLGGVAAGVARTLGVDVVIVRIVFVVAAFAWIGIPAYLVAWIAIPWDDGTSGLTHEEPRDIGLVVALALIGLGALIFVRHVIPGGWDFGGRFVGPLFLIAGGVAILVLRRPSARTETPSPTNTSRTNPTPSTLRARTGAARRGRARVRGHRARAGDRVRRPNSGNTRERVDANRAVGNDPTRTSRAMAKPAGQSTQAVPHARHALPPADRRRRDVLPRRSRRDRHQSRDRVRRRPRDRRCRARHLGVGRARPLVDPRRVDPRVAHAARPPRSTCRCAVASANRSTRRRRSPRFSIRTGSARAISSSI